MKPTQETIRQAVERYGPSVLRRCRAFTSDRHLADDLAQEVFARLCEVVGKPRRDREDVPWKLVEGVMRNVFLEHLRRKKRVLMVVEPEVESVVHSPDTPADHAVREDQRSLVRTLVEHLGLAEQQVILGRHFFGMKMAELTRWLGLPRSTIVDTYNRGMMRLRDMARDHGVMP